MLESNQIIGLIIFGIVSISLSNIIAHFIDAYKYVAIKELEIKNKDK